MEQILHLYSLDYDPARPLICFDERPCVLHKDKVEPLAMKPGQAARFDYEYERRGTCNLLVALEPLSGFRIVEVSKQRRGVDFHPVHAAPVGPLCLGRQDHLGPGQLEHAQTGIVLHPFASPGGLRLGAALRDDVYTEEGFLAEHG